MIEPLTKSESNKVRIKDFIVLDETFVLRVLVQMQSNGFLGLYSSRKANPLVVAHQKWKSFGPGAIYFASLSVSIYCGGGRK